MKKIILYLVIAIVVIFAGLLTYVKVALPAVPLKENIKVEVTPERVKRGEYLANSVLVCMDCHSTRDWSKFSGPLVPGTLGCGGELFDQKFGFPGKFISPNITPTNLEKWTDAEIYRAITSGVNKEGKAMFPVMPYKYYGSLDEEDVFAVIAYLRSLPKQDKVNEASVPDFPMNFIINTIPTINNPQKRPAKEESAVYGKYLVDAAACVDCHTPFEKGELLMDGAYGGGRVFDMPFAVLTSPNITPDNETGIGNWTKEAFISRFKMYDTTNYKAPVLGQGDRQSIMPWTMYGTMDSTDLSAIYVYLKTLKPISNKVEVFKAK